MAYNRESTLLWHFQQSTTHFAWTNAVLRNATIASSVAIVSSLTEPWRWTMSAGKPVAPALLTVSTTSTNQDSVSSTACCLRLYYFCSRFFKNPSEDSSWDTSLFSPWTVLENPFSSYDASWDGFPSKDACWIYWKNSPKNVYSPGCSKYRLTLATSNRIPIFNGRVL